MANIELNCAGNLRALVVKNVKETGEIGLPEGYAYEDLYQNVFCAECATKRLADFTKPKVILYRADIKEECGECGKMFYGY